MNILGLLLAVAVLFGLAWLLPEWARSGMDFMLLSILIIITAGDIAGRKRKERNGDEA